MKLIISSIRDLLESSQSLLILGRPGVGKTTIIREIARILADEMEKRVVIIDTSNEIAGDGNIPHPVRIEDSNTVVIQLNFIAIINIYHINF